MPLLPFLLGFLPLLGVAYFWGLGSPARWQGGDEIQPGLYALDLLRHWNLRLFVTFGQTPSTGCYLCWFFLKLTHSPFWAYQLPATLLALGAVLAGYQAVRLRFPASFALLFLALFALNFWSLQASRNLLCLLFWESLVLYLLAWFLKAPPSSSLQVESGLLGFALGLGPFTFPCWPALVPVVLGLAAWKLRSKPRRGPGPWIGFGLSFALALVPFLVAAGQEGYGGHLMKVGFWRNFSVLSQARIILQYLYTLFWNLGPKGPLHGGGFLNLFSASFFFLGMMELVRSRDRFPLFLSGAGLLILMTPGFLSNGMEPNRVLLVLPLLILVSTLGVRALAFVFPPRGRAWAAALLLLISCGLDLGRSFFPGNPGTETVREKKESYAVLETLSSRFGPGLVFPEMIPAVDDYSLSFYCFPFNAAMNPGLSPEKASWCGLFTEAHYEPFLKSRFPGARWIEFPGTKSGAQNPYVLGVFPISAPDRPLFLAWNSFYADYHRFNFQAMDLPNGKGRVPLLADMARVYPSVPADPFLQSCFFEKLLYNYAWETTFYPGEAGSDWPRFSPLFRASFDRSYQDLELCEKFGRLLALEGQKQEAKAVFQKALKLSPGNAWLQKEMGQWGLDN